MDASKFEKSRSFSEVLRAFNYQSEREAAIDLAILSASTRYAEFSEECQRFEEKYGIGYLEFEKRVSAKENEEDFVEEDDLMAWKFAKEGAEFWFKKVEDLKSAI